MLTVPGVTIQVYRNQLSHQTSPFELPCQKSAKIWYLSRRCKVKTLHPITAWLLRDFELNVGEDEEGNWREVEKKRSSTGKEDMRERKSITRKKYRKAE